MGGPRLPAGVSSAKPGIPSGSSGRRCDSGPSVCPDTLPGWTANPPEAPTAWKSPHGPPNEAAEGDATEAKFPKAETFVQRWRRTEDTWGQEQLRSFPPRHTHGLQMKEHTLWRGKRPTQGKKISAREKAVRHVLICKPDVIHSISSSHTSQVHSVQHKFLPSSRHTHSAFLIKQTHW